MATSWDQQKFFASLGPMQSMAEVFLQAFLQSVQSNLSALTLAQQQQDYRQIHRVAHSIKGCAGQICCSLLAELAAQLEFYAQNDLSKVQPAIESLLEQAERDCDSIRMFINAQR
jgi:HPt (histidine-containing phosphotransfer) domain-containing protein